VCIEMEVSKRSVVHVASQAMVLACNGVEILYIQYWAGGELGVCC
jgi:hypothetical protein